MSHEDTTLSPRARSRQERRRASTEPVSAAPGHRAGPVSSAGAGQVPLGPWLPSLPAVQPSPPPSPAASPWGARPGRLATSGAVLCYAVTVRVPLHPLHDAHDKRTAPCPFSSECTDSTGGHHTFLSLGTSPGQVQEAWQGLGHRVTRVELARWIMPSEGQQQ